MNQIKNRAVLGRESSLNTGFSQSVALLAFTVLLLSVNNCLAVNSVEELRKYLTEKTNFVESDFASLENGRLVAKLLEVSNKREVAVWGVIPIKASPDLALQTFQETLARQSQAPSTDFGDFSSTPNLNDLNNLILEDKDIEDLKKCQPGNCKVKLSAEMIERFQTEVDWNAPDYSRQATVLFRQILLEYVQDYLARGDAALIAYNDKREVVSLEEEQKSLLNNLMWVNETAPEFYKYLQDFPRSEPPNITNKISWAKVKFGLKPVILITQTINYQPENSHQVLSVTKQLYANHYFDSSLGLAAFIKFPATGTEFDSYMLYVNHSRADSLGGLLGKMVRGRVEKEALAKLEPLLQGTKYYSESNLKKQNEAAVVSTDHGILVGLFKQNYLILLVVLIVAAVSMFWFGKHIAKKWSYKINQAK